MWTASARRPTLAAARLRSTAIEAGTEARYTFTVFTPTFNRARTLPRAYESLREQTFGDFEWLVVDDGSADDTPDLVRRWSRDSPFPIRYIRQPNSGKHVADNRAAQAARGALYATLDSDDWYVPTALERFVAVWNTIDPAERDSFVGVVALCGDSTGAVIGTPFPAGVVDSTYSELVERYGITGDKTGFGRTEIVRKFPHPEIPGEKLAMEGLVYKEVARRYRVRCVNEVLQLKEYRTEGESARMRRLLVENPVTAKLFYLELVRDSHGGRLARLRLDANHVRYALHAGLGRQSARDAPSKLWWAGGAPVGLGLFLRDRAVFRGARRRVAG